MITTSATRSRRFSAVTSSRIPLRLRPVAVVVDEDDHPVEPPRLAEVEPAVPRHLLLDGAEVRGRAHDLHLDDQAEGEDGEVGAAVATGDRGG